MVFVLPYRYRTTETDGLGRSWKTDHYGTDGGEVTLRFEDGLDTEVHADLSFSIAGSDRSPFLIELEALIQRFRI